MVFIYKVNHPITITLYYIIFLYRLHSKILNKYRLIKKQYDLSDLYICYIVYNMEKQQFNLI